MLMMADVITWQYFEVVNLERKYIHTRDFTVELPSPINEIKFNYYKRVTGLNVCFEENKQYHFHHNAEISIPHIDLRDLPLEDSDYEIEKFEITSGKLRVYTKYFKCDLIPTLPLTVDNLRYWNSVPDQYLKTTVVGDELQIVWVFNRGVVLNISSGGKLIIKKKV